MFRRTVNQRPLIGLAMLLWTVLGFFALGAVSEDTVTTELSTSKLTTFSDAGNGAVSEDTVTTEASTSKLTTSSDAGIGAVSEDTVATEASTSKLTTFSDADNGVSEDTIATEASTSKLTTFSEANNDPEPIPYSNGSGQVFETSDKLIQSYRRQQPVSPELPAVIPSWPQLATKIPSIELEAPLENIITPESMISTSAPTISAPGSTSRNPGPPVTIAGSTIATPGVTVITPESTVSTAASTTGSAPPRPIFNRSLHLRDELTVPSSDYTEVYDVAWHAESNTARTIIENRTTIYRTLQADDHVQFLKIEDPQRICTKSAPIPASPKDKSFPNLPDLTPFQFVGYNTEEGRQVELWKHVVVGKPGEGGAVQGESLNFTHDFFVFRDGEDLVPIRYAVVTDSSVLGAASDSYTHRYSVLRAPTAPILPDITTECDILEDFQAEPQTTQKINAKELEEILTPTLLR